MRALSHGDNWYSLCQVLRGDAACRDLCPQRRVERLPPLGCRCVAVISQALQSEWPETDGNQSRRSEADSYSVADGCNVAGVHSVAVVSQALRSKWPETAWEAFK